MILFYVHDIRIRKDTEWQTRPIQIEKIPLELVTGIT